MAVALAVVFWLWKKKGRGRGEKTHCHYQHISPRLSPRQQNVGKVCICVFGCWGWGGIRLRLGLLEEGRTEGLVVAVMS